VAEDTSIKAQLRCGCTDSVADIGAVAALDRGSPSNEVGGPHSKIPAREDARRAPAQHRSAFRRKNLPPNLRRAELEDPHVIFAI
jgi:hypothetical protein